MLHPESDCLFEVLSEQEYDELELFMECSDVTGIPEHEEQFARQKK